MSTETKITHTPVPWKAFTGGMDDTRIIAAGWIVADCNSRHFHGAEFQANARLIAAAPDMLLALETLLDHAGEQYPHFEDERGQRDIKAARAAIVKATW